MITFMATEREYDFTKRDWQNILREHRQPWELAKGFDASAVISEIRDKHRMPDMDEAVLWLYVNNQERQRGNTKEMIWKIPEIINELSKNFRLMAGDLIYTGSPKGSGLLRLDSPLKEELTVSGHSEA